jgi:tetratricopeptide (TPR) repeat protein
VRGVGFGGETPWINYVGTAAEAVALYFKLGVWPHPLVVDYGLTPGQGGWVLGVGAAVVMATLLAVGWALRRGWTPGFAGAAALIMLAPTTSVVPVRFQPIAEHRMYLPLAVLLPGAVIVGFAALGRRAARIGLAAAAGLTLLTVVRNADYRDEEAMWRDTIAKRPDNWRAYNARATALFQRQRLAEGIATLEAALRLNPSEPKLLNNYANALALPMIARWPEAIAAGERAVALDPAYPEARNSLASAYLKIGRVNEAADQFAAAQRLMPDSAEICSNLCDALRQAGRAAEAVASGETALRLKPDMVVAHGNLGLALADLGRADEAIGHYETALRLKPDYLEVRNNLAVLFLNLGRLAEADAQLAEALRLKPDYADAHNTLGIVRVQQGRLADAEAEVASALRIRPDYGNARDNLQRLHALQPAGAAAKE